MATLTNALTCAVLGLVFWTILGLAITTRLPAPGLAGPLAPTVGWAVHSVIALPVFGILGFSSTTVVATSLAALLICAWTLRKWVRRLTRPNRGNWVLIASTVGALLLAGAILAIIVPTRSAAGVALADPIFDHSKIALVDEMVRSGVPPANPFFHEAGAPDTLSYYYLWHFSAAVLALAIGSSGWEADAAMTGFTAFASLALMMGFATWWSGRARSAVWVLLLAATASIRPLVALVVSPSTSDALTGVPSGFGTWLFQTTWAPQHMAAAGCALVAIYVLAQLAQAPRWGLSALLGLMAVASFESSTWVGALTLPIAALAVLGLALAHSQPSDRWRLILHVAGALVLALVIAVPFLRDQLHSASMRADGFPISLRPYKVFGGSFAGVSRWLLDVPGFLVIFLTVELAAIYPVGLLMLRRMSKDPAISDRRRNVMMSFGLTALAAIFVSCLLASTVGQNNDLAWRGVLPAILVLTAAASAGLGCYWQQLRAIDKLLMSLILAVAVYGGGKFLLEYVTPKPVAASKDFVESASLWQAVQRQSAPLDRIANNPLFLEQMTLWPINISWALLGNRRSCFAGAELALPFAAVSRKERGDIDALFIRTFAGKPHADDVRQIATRFGCNVVVVSALDGAWAADPFANSQWYRLVETESNRWRIYRASDVPNR